MNVSKLNLDLSIGDNGSQFEMSIVSKFLIDLRNFQF